MKKLLAFLVILTLILTVNVSFAENETSGLNETSIYVSCDGSDSFGNGTIDNPYQTLNYTIEKAQNNSNIYLKSGTYNSTGYEIKNKSISITGIGEVTIDGRNGEVSQNIFKVHNGSSLILNNIKFINGFADFSSDNLSPIVNEGNLYIFNSSFDNFKTIKGAIRNENNLYLTNVSANNLDILWNIIYQNLPSGAFMWIAEELQHRMSGEFLSSTGNCEIRDSKLISAVYNGGNMTIISSELGEFISNNKSSNNNFIYSYIDESFIHLLRLSYSNLLVVNNSIINCSQDTNQRRHAIEYSNIIFKNITSTQAEYGYRIPIDFSNFTAESSVFTPELTFISSNVDIKYSTILNNMNINYNSVVDVNFNWWGDNKGPVIYKDSTSSKITADKWIIMNVELEADNIFKVDFTKYTNGGNFANLDFPSKFTPRLVKLDTESGKFLRDSGYLVNGTFKTSLINAQNTIVYATVDQQILRTIVGEGLSNYTIYISNDKGNDYYFDGSQEYPYKTLSKAISEAVSGNTIYVLEGDYTLNWNANLKISKNLTFVGVGNANILRPNNRNIFIVDEKGILNIENLNFTTSTSDGYVDPLIVMNKGCLNIKSSNFYDIKSQSVILSKNSEYINLDNVSFNHIQGPAILGFSGNLYVNNSRFSNGSTIICENSLYGCDYEPVSYHYDDHYIHFFIALSSNMTIENSVFKDSTLGAIGHHFFGIYRLDFWNIQKIGTYYTFVNNSTFENNNWEGEPKLIIGLEIGYNEYFKGYSTINNCTFKNNRGHLLFATNITNSKFIDNIAIPYELRKDADFSSMGYHIYPKALLSVDLINNSYFYGNSYLSKDFEEKIVEAHEVYYSTFINNTAAYGGALSDASEVHYCVFINNTATYGGNDIFVYNGNLNASSNWWGSNQRPESDRVYVFIGELTMDDWVIMSLEYKDGQIIASLSNLSNANGSIYKLNHTLHSREVVFSSDFADLIPNATYLVDNIATSKVIKNTTKDFDVFGKIDNQILSLTIYNNSTQLLMSNMTLYGKDNQFDISLQNVNGHRISNQVLNVLVYNNQALYDSFTLTTDILGNTHFNIDYPVGEYKIIVNYAGNGYFEKTTATSNVVISSISTKLTSYNYTYHGKNNKFYAILTDKNGKYVLNQNLTLKIYDLKGKLLHIAEVKTGTGGRADVLLSLDVGTYKLSWDFKGNEWYENSFSESIITIKPIKTNITLLNTTFYGQGNDYEFTFKDSYGTLIVGETITFTISNKTDKKEFKLKTNNNGIATININLKPGVYDISANYAGDDVYGPCYSSAVLKIEPVFVTFDFKSHASIPKNGVFTAILVDMYGKKVSGQNVTLELYDDKINKKYIAVSDANGEANFKIDVGEGDYFAILNFNGNTWYKSAIGASKITVNPNIVINNIYINGSNFIQYYGENKYFLINFNDSNAYSLEGKIIHVSISSNDWFKSYDVESDPFGCARLQITLEPGIYNITYKYINEYYDVHGEGTNTIIVYKMPTDLLASDLIMNYGEAQFFEVKLVNKNGSPLPNLAVNITVDNESQTVMTNQKGIAKILLNFDLGYHNITYSFNDDNFEVSNGASKVLVVDSNQTATKLETEYIEARENSSFTYHVALTDLLDAPIISSEIILNITDSEGNSKEFKQFTNKSGVANFNLNLSYGTYTFKAYYNGNENYLSSFNTNNVYVRPIVNVTETILFGNDFNIVNGDNKSIYFVILTTIDGKFIKNQEIEFIVKNNSYYSITDDYGRAYLNVPFAPGSYPVVTKFNGSENLTKASTTHYISVDGDVCYLYSQNIIKSYNNDTMYYVGLFDANNEALSNKIIKFSIGGKIYERLTDVNGLACFDEILSPGVYNITATYQGRFADEFACVSNNITVLTTIIGEDKISYGNADFDVKFLDLANVSLKTTEVYFIVNNLGFKVNTNSNGVAIFNMDMPIGEYKIMAINPISGENKTFNLKIKSSVTASNLVKYYKGSSKFVAKFLNKDGKLLKYAKVKFTINGKVYTRTTNSKGVASLKINLKPGIYKITVLNTNTHEKLTKKITVKKTIISKNKVVKASKKINFQVKILKSNGKIAKKVVVKFKINKKTYKVKTNKKGIAKLNIKLKKGKYTVLTTYRGLTVKNKVRCC